MFSALFLCQVKPNGVVFASRGPSRGDSSGAQSGRESSHVAGVRQTYPSS